MRIRVIAIYELSRWPSHLIDTQKTTGLTVLKRRYSGAQEALSLVQSETTLIEGPVRVTLDHSLPGALWGTAEAAFMEPVKTAMPLIVPALGIVAKNTVFYGQ